MGFYSKPPRREPKHKFGHRHHVFSACFKNISDQRLHKSLCHKLNKIVNRLMKDNSNKILQDQFINIRHKLRDMEKSLPEYESLRFNYYV